MAKITRMETTSTPLFTNQKEVDRAIQAAVDQYESYNRSLRKMGKRKKRRKQKTVVQSG